IARAVVAESICWDAAIAPGRRYHGGHQLSDRGGVRPAHLDFENLDSRTKLLRQSLNILASGDQTGARIRRTAAQQIDFRSAEEVMVRECSRVDEYGPEPPQRREEFLRTSDSGKGQKTLASQPLPVDRG